VATRIWTSPPQNWASETSTGTQFVSTAKSFVEGLKINTVLKQLYLPWSDRISEVHDACEDDFPFTQLENVLSEFNLQRMFARFASCWPS
jgi:hypothetical protein